MATKARTPPNSNLPKYPGNHLTAAYQPSEHPSNPSISRVATSQNTLATI